MTRLLLHAPGVHGGGGLVLLRSLLSAAGSSLALANLDARADVAAPRNTHWVKPTFGGRLRAERLLASTARDGDAVLCFHGLPPIYRVAGKVTVFVQNRLHVDATAPAAGRTRVRLPLERLICRMFRGRVHEYVVQTPSMARALRDWHGAAPRIRVIPFQDAEPAARGERRFDFLYVADGEAHKNHRNLLAAWRLLAAEGLRPSLALTADPGIDTAGLRVQTLGRLSRDELLQAYGAAGALIYPSSAESFGLPLVEASRAGLPIIASELDYVRDVCEPVQTFDPRSPVSIARAVRRFLGAREPPLRVRSSAEFVRELLEGTPAAPAA